MHDRLTHRCGNHRGEGFAAVVLDAQHGLWDVASLIAGIGGVNHAEAAPMVRVPHGDFALVSRALDFGAEAIIAPMINSAADARHFVAAAKYPPLGERSWGPIRACRCKAAPRPSTICVRLMTAR